MQVIRKKTAWTLSIAFSLSMALSPASALASPSPADEGSSQEGIEKAAEAEKEAALKTEEKASDEALPQDTPSKEEGGEEMLTGESMVYIADKIATGMLGGDFFAEYGVQAEIMSKWFGVGGRFAVFQIYPDEYGFCYDMGFVFHYYPFGDGPSGLYVGPGFMYIHMKQNPDPVEPALNDSKHEIPRGYGAEWDYMTPFAEVGYRHRFDFYLTLGVEGSIGAAVIDQQDKGDTGVYWSVTPTVGVAW